MIVCVSLNPAIDTRLNCELFERGRVNRAISATPEPGGKSLHVAMVLRTLGAQPTGPDVEREGNAATLKAEMKQAPPR